MIGNMRGSDVTVSFGGNVVGKMQSISAADIRMEGVVKSYKLPSSGEITLPVESINMNALASLFGADRVPLPKYDVEVTGWRRMSKLPNGSTRLPRKKRLQKKWLKRYYREERTLYRGCTFESATT